MSKINLVMDCSMLDVLQTCEYKFKLRHVLNKSTYKIANPLDKGSAFHHGHEAYYKELKASKDWVKAVDRSLIAARMYMASPESNLEGQEPDRIIEVLEETHRRWREVDLRYEILKVEQTFSFILYEDDNVRFVMIGKIDLLVNDLPNYINMPIDHKSYSRDFPISRKANQFTCYSYVCRSNHLLVNRIGLQTSIPSEKKHKRIPLSYDPLYWEQWKSNTISWFWRYYDCLSEDKFVDNPTSCTKFNRICEYYEVCDTSGEENKTYKLNTNFKTVPQWDVSKVLVS